jgi:hypothetical protein
MKGHFIIAVVFSKYFGLKQTLYYTRREICTTGHIYEVSTDKKAAFKFDGYDQTIKPLIFEICQELNEAFPRRNEIKIIYQPE